MAVTSVFIKDFQNWTDVIGFTVNIIKYSYKKSKASNLTTEKFLSFSLVFTLNCFSFDGRYFKQINGVPTV